MASRGRRKQATKTTPRRQRSRSTSRGQSKSTQGSSSRSSQNQPALDRSNTTSEDYQTDEEQHSESNTNGNSQPTTNRSTPEEEVKVEDASVSSQERNQHTNNVPTQNSDFYYKSLREICSTKEGADEFYNKTRKSVQILTNMKIEFLERILACSTTLDKVDQMILIEFKYYCNIYKLSYNDQLGEMIHQAKVKEEKFYSSTYYEKYKFNEQFNTKNILSHTPQYEQNSTNLYPKYRDFHNIYDFCTSVNDYYFRLSLDDICYNEIDKATSFLLRLDKTSYQKAATQAMQNMTTYFTINDKYKITPPSTYRLLNLPGTINKLQNELNLTSTTSTIHNPYRRTENN